MPVRCLPKQCSCPTCLRYCSEMPLSVCDERHLSRSSQSPWDLDTCLPKQRAGQAAEPGTDVQTPAWPLSSPPFFETSGPGAASLTCVFMPLSTWGILRASVLASLPKKDKGMPEDGQMFLSPGCRVQPGVTCRLEQGQYPKDPPEKGRVKTWSNL